MFNNVQIYKGLDLSIYLLVEHVITDKSFFIRVDQLLFVSPLYLSN